VTGGGARPPAVEAWLLAFGAAVVVAVEFMVIGLAPAMAEAMRLTPQGAGWFVTGFALGSAVLGPAAAIATRRLRADRAMALALLPYAANLLVPLLREPLLIQALRVVQGATLPLFIGVASEVLSRLLGRDDRAIARIYLGVTVGGLLGVPGGVAIAAAAGWAAPLLLTGGLALAAVAAIAALPRLRLLAAPQAGIGDQLRVAAEPAVALHLLLSLLQFAAMFCTYAYLGTILDGADQGGAKPGGAAMGGWLLLFGIAGLAGNWLAGHLAGRSVTAAAVAVAALITLPGLVLQAMPLPPAALVPLLAAWGGAHAAGFVISQLRVTRAAAHTPRLAAALNISAANLGIALGAAAGGWALSRGGIGALGWAGCGLGLLALGLALATGRQSHATLTFRFPK
jgi:predicted MFS family arabinose efflux permease